MKKLVDFKDKNGTSIQSYVETLIDKLNEVSPESTITLIIAIPPEQLEVLSNVDLTVLPDALSQMASQMRKKPVTKAELKVNPPETQAN